MTIEEWAKDFKSYVNALDMPRDDYNGIIEYIDDAIDLLKEQEAVDPINSYGTFRCGNCRNIVGYNDSHGRGYQNKFCSKCGKAVKWE